MGGDYTRFTFRPENDYTSVLRQQGRVALDADHNELAEILARRLRVETIDVLGRCTVPRDPADPADGLPQSFRIYVTGYGAGAFAIGAGRAYVDGLLADCRGDPTSAPRYDTGLGETYFTAPLPWNAQPRLPQPPALTAPVADRVDLLYLDVWQREVSYIEDPLLREVALGGPDTTTRMQTIWQVRVLENVGVSTCADVDGTAAWQDLVAPSGGRLTTSVDPAFSPDDEPCTIGPPGGYRGLENRLYRVEIHRAGGIAANDAAVDAGTALFKWSRDNASFASALEHLEQGVDDVGDPVTFVTVRLFGRDQTLRFEPDDWVEVLDDYTEYRQEAGQMRRISAVDEANRIITLKPPLDLNPAVLDPGTVDPLTGRNDTLERRHTRVRRWGKDAPAPGAAGFRAVIQGPISLGDGVQIEFTLPSGTFHVGDYWVFAARTSTGQIETFTTARPRGVLHHFGRLALIAWGADQASTEVRDCRTPWPPEGGTGCCTVVVHPGESIQAAIDSLPPAGGCVCLKVGTHDIADVIRITRSNVVLHGETIGAVVRRQQPHLFLMVQEVSAEQPVRNVVVDGIRFEGPADRAAPIAIGIDGADEVTLRCCEIVAIGAQGAPLFTIGVLAQDSQRLTITENAINGFTTGIWARSGSLIHVGSNRASGTPLALLPGRFLVGTGVNLDADVSGPCHAKGNVLSDFAVGVRISAAAAGSIVASNRIERASPAALSSIPPLLDPPDDVVRAADPTLVRAFGVEVRAPRCTVTENSIAVSHASHGGVVATGAFTAVARNRVDSTVTGADAPRALGILLAPPTEDTLLPGCAIEANVLTGVQDGIVVVGRTALLLPAASVRGNVVESGLTGPNDSTVGVFLFLTRSADVRDNELASSGVLLAGGLGNCVAGNRMRGGAGGLLLVFETEPLVSDNSVTDASLMGIALILVTGGDCRGNTVRGSAIIGIGVAQGRDTRLVGNRVEGALFGVHLETESHPWISETVVEQVHVAGITVLESTHPALHDNRLAWCGYDASGSDALFRAAIYVSDCIGQSAVVSCIVVEAGQPPEGGQLSPLPVHAIVARTVERVHVRGNGVTGAIGLKGDLHTAVLVEAGRSAEILDNVVTGFGLSRLIDAPTMVTFRLSPLHTTVRLEVIPHDVDVMLSNNRCVQAVGKVPDQPRPAATVHVMGRRLSVVGNQIRADDPRLPSLSFFPDTLIPPIFVPVLLGYLTAVGNVSSGAWLPPLPEEIRPTPVDDFNHISVP